MAMPPMLETLLNSWKISFQSAHFFLFLPLVTAVYFLLPQKARRFWLLFTSYYFYFFSAPSYLPVLMGGTLYTYIIGLLLGRLQNKAAKNTTFWLGIIGLVGTLSLFKYSSFYGSVFGAGFPQDYFITAKAMGISFYTFTALGYLIDTWRGDCKPERNFLSFALFLGFFANITSGPITRAGDMLPQINNTAKRFSAQNTADALRLMLVGFFKKLAVADMLGVYVDTVYTPGLLGEYRGFTLLLAAVLFMLQLYFDFSGYTDIALGAAQMVGITLPPNFKNPYFATNFSGFWQRWHISLSNWLQDYIFTPLVWSRWTEKLPLIGKKITKPPVLTSLAIVFLLSGIWHGDTASYAVWGALMAAYRIGEELLHRHLGKPQKKPPLQLRVAKNAAVLALWCFSLVFFRVGMMGSDGHVGDAFAAIAHAVQGFSLTGTWQVLYNAFANAFFNKPFIVYGIMGFTAACTAFAVWADWAQCFKLKGKSLVTGMQQLHKPLRWVLYYAMLLCCFAAFIAQSGESFLYGGY